MNVIQRDRFSVLSSWFSVLGSQVLGSWFLVLGSWFSVLSSRFSVLGSRFLVLSSWFSVPGSWFSVLGSQFPVLGSQFSVLSSRFSHMHLSEQFLLRRDITFLNHGSFGACPRPVFETYQQWQRTLEMQPVEFLGCAAIAEIGRAHV